MVHGHPLDRRPARVAAQAGRADGAGEVRRVRHAARPEAVPRPAAGLLRVRARLAVHRGAATRRGTPPVDAPDGRHVRPGPAEPERRADPRGRALEVRLQEREVDRADPAHERRAADRVEQGRPPGVRLLLERHPRRRPPALEPSDRAADRRVPTPPHAPVQRIRRSGGAPLHRHGPPEVLLKRPVSRRARIALKAAIWGTCLGPLATLGYWFARDDLTANPISFVTTTLGDWTLRILLASLAMTPIRLVFGVSWPITLRRLLGLFAFFYVCLHGSVWLAKVGRTDQYWYVATLVLLLSIRLGDVALRAVRRRRERRTATVATAEIRMP